MSSYADFLQNELGSHDPSTVDDLNLEGGLLDAPKLTEEHKKTLEKYSSLVHLTISNGILESLENFPKLPKLEILELHNNSLTGEDLKEVVTRCSNLYKIDLSENKIESLDVFDVLKGHKKIIKLNIEGNPITSSNPDYRK